MNPWDIVICLLLAVALVAVLICIGRQKKKGGCIGCSVQRRRHCPAIKPDRSRLKNKTQKPKGILPIAGCLFW